MNIIGSWLTIKQIKQTSTELSILEKNGMGSILQDRTEQNNGIEE